jgi:hypothetical protein
MIECIVKALRDVKVTGLKLAGTKKSIHVKGWCGSGWCDTRVILTV